MKIAVATFVSLVSFANAEFNEKNALGFDLQPCSTSGMALTGPSREGYCMDSYGNYGSHICMNIDNSNDDINNFCNVESIQERLPACIENSLFPCQEDTRDMCPVQNYCVHQCYFSHYLEEIGNCDDIQEIKCDAVNIKSLIAYGKRHYIEKYDNALNCIAQKCNLSDEEVASFKSKKCGTTFSSMKQMAFGTGNNADITEEVTKQIVLWGIVGAVLLLFVLGGVRSYFKETSKSKMVQKAETAEVVKENDIDTESVADTASIATETH